MIAMHLYVGMGRRPDEMFLPGKNIVRNGGKYNSGFVFFVFFDGKSGRFAPFLYRSGRRGARRFPAQEANMPKSFLPFAGNQNLHKSTSCIILIKTSSF